MKTALVCLAATVAFGAGALALAMNFERQPSTAQTTPVAEPEASKPSQTYSTAKAAAAYWKAACDIKHGHIARDQGGQQVISYLQQMGIDPALAYADPNATLQAELLDRAAGTNCFA